MTSRPGFHQTLSHVVNHRHGMPSAPGEARLNGGGAVLQAAHSERPRHSTGVGQLAIAMTTTRSSSILVPPCWAWSANPRIVTA